MINAATHQAPAPSRPQRSDNDPQISRKSAIVGKNGWRIRRRALAAEFHRRTRAEKTHFRDRGIRGICVVRNRPHDAVPQPDLGAEQVVGDTVIPPVADRFGEAADGSNKQHRRDESSRQYV